MSGYNGMQLPDYIMITREDFLRMVQEAARQQAARTLTLKEAAAAYGKDERTIRKYIECGMIQGQKTGGLWEIETPQDRAKRMNNNL